MTTNGGSLTGVIADNQPRPQPPSAEPNSPTLIRFGSDSGEDNRTPTSPLRRPPQTTTPFSPVAPQKSVFGDFDPWGVPTSTARTMNLLDLEDNLSPPSDSEQSEVRTVGSEAFKKKSSSLRSSPVPLSNQFDPFGSGSSGGLGETFGNPNAFLHSSSSENLPTHTTPQQGSLFSSNFLNPSTGMAHRHSSAPDFAALGNPSFAPTLSDIPQSPKQESRAMHSRGVPTQHANPAMTANYQSTTGGKTSGNLMTGATSPLGFHAHSTGHLQQPPVGGSSGGGKGQNWDDPFADLGNMKMGINVGPNTAKQSRTQTAPQGVKSQPGHSKQPQHGSWNPKPSSHSPQHSSHGQRHQPTTSPQSSRKQAAYKPNYSSSVLGDRTERGPRPKTGQLSCVGSTYIFRHTHQFCRVSANCIVQSICHCCTNIASSLSRVHVLLVSAKNEEQVCTYTCMFTPTVPRYAATFEG